MVSRDVLIKPRTSHDANAILGFKYSQTKDRMWRKNRQTATGSSCVGRDVNRHWPYMWDVAGGASDDPCAEDYRGESQADSPEAGALAAGLKTTKSAQGLKMYIDYHSYSQLFMTRAFPALRSKISYPG